MNKAKIEAATAEVVWKSLISGAVCVTGCTDGIITVTLQQNKPVQFYYS